jgi:phospholipid N-methyltransferase
MMNKNDMKVRDNPNLEAQRASIEKKFSNRNYILLKGLFVNKKTNEDEYLMAEYSTIFLDTAVDWRQVLKQAKLEESRKVVGGNFVTDTPDTREAKAEVDSAISQIPVAIIPKAEEVKTEDKEKEIKKRLKK